MRRHERDRRPPPPGLTGLERRAYLLVLGSMVLNLVLLLTGAVPRAVSYAVFLTLAVAAAGVAIRGRTRR
ncbi:hypothetical protein [Saccharothrix yanglingensis]|uniref:Uncharacterized protein n=1 Tax=Saccharothrix yanglingensis TaxID=659496 RepID=A0ABU0X8G3_9PSEU|nr:hypothetical protein [Saccharothrix yanglingensis]MDQ2588429.1 hypothetical protein [Saccharothrix yanglingensis]